MTLFNKSIFTLSFVFVSAYIISGCKADRFQQQPLASFSVTHAAPGGPAVDVVVDGLVTSVNRLNFGNTTISKTGSALIYLPASTGNRNVKISADSGKTSLIEANVAMDLGKIYSFFAMDTVLNSKLKVLQLTDDLTLPASGMAHVRFLHLAPATAPVDVTFTRGTDSVTMSGMSYAGTTTTPNVATLAKFTPIPAGTYTIKVKSPGTQTVLAQSAATSLGAVKIFTFYVKGGAKSQPLSVSSMTNY